MKTSPISSILRLLGRIFQALYEEGAHTLEFGDELLLAEASDACLFPWDQRFELTGFICYDPTAVSRRRALLPSCIRKTEPKGWQWRLRRISKHSFAFRLERLDSIRPSRCPLWEYRISDATPEIIAAHALSDEQALLAKVRYNRLIDIFLGITSFSLQNHLRTTVKGLGQIEIDEIYVGIDRHGCQYVLPVQAKGGSDQISSVQARQDIACCAEKFPGLVCRAISAQFMDQSRIAMFELQLDGAGLVKIVEERHYCLVPADQITGEDQAAYRQRALGAAR